MTDIVERLRNTAEFIAQFKGADALALEAADEIERLRREIADMKKPPALRPGARYFLTENLSQSGVGKGD